MMIVSNRVGLAAVAAALCALAIIGVMKVARATVASKPAIHLAPIPSAAQLPAVQPAPAASLAPEAARR